LVDYQQIELGIKRMPPVDFYSYFANIDGVAGWLNSTTALMSNSIMEWQSDRGIRGNVCEIGVHHGRYFIALATALQRDEVGIAIDLFSRQEENVDGSGAGDRAAFEQHVNRFLNPHSVVAMETNSLNLKPADITAHGKVRFFSVDGGHTEEATANDLFLAEKSIVDEGVVALDDIMNTQWTGVIGGLCRYKSAGGTLIGFAMVPNKLFLCRPRHAGEYRDFLGREYRANVSQRNAEMIGDRIDIFSELPEHLITTARHWSVDGAGKRPEEAGESAFRLRDELDKIQSSRRYRLASFMAGIYNKALMR
jgi:hypothetical protein